MKYDAFSLFKTLFVWKLFIHMKPRNNKNIKISPGQWQYHTSNSWEFEGKRVVNTDEQRLYLQK